MTSESAWLTWTLGVAVVAVAMTVYVIWRKGQPFAAGDVFRASRMGSGNRLFPTQVLITPTAIVQYTPRFLGRREETLHMAHVASVRIDSGIMLSNLRVESSGGASAILCHGHHKGDTVTMKNLIERYQTEYYRNGAVGRPTSDR